MRIVLTLRNNLGTASPHGQAIKTSGVPCARCFVFVCFFVLKLLGVAGRAQTPVCAPTGIYALHKAPAVWP